MKIHLPQTVLEASLDRIRWLFDEFDEVIVSTSGGKDSTVVFNLALQVAREKKRLPLKVFWLDQEAEWQATVDHVEEIMSHPDVEPLWFQIPFRLFNSTSTTDHWLNCWDPEAEELWIHPKVDYAYTENKYGTDRFSSLFRHIPLVEWPDKSVCFLAGVRTEESPARYTGLTGGKTWKWATWGTGLGKPNHVTMYPIYDWSTTDVWKYIHDNNVSYNAIYDEMYRYGIPVKNMRVSNVHHETAIHSLWFLQEMEGGTWERLTARVKGVDAVTKLGRDTYMPSTLPFMFRSWFEYRDYLLEHLIEEDDVREKLAKRFAWQESIWGDVIPDSLGNVQVRAVIQHDHEFVILRNWEMAPQNYGIHMLKKKAEAERENANQESE